MKRFLAGSLILLLAVVLGAESSSAAIVTFMSSIGSGSAGISDGVNRASFLMPSAVAVAHDGVIFVTDEAAQRVRSISPDGSVHTVAGSGEINPSGVFVDGGFQNGPVLRARFNHPSGIAIGNAGRIYIADTFNHCIRLISRGVVATAAGQCGRAGNQDGDASHGLLEFPRGLSYTARGDLYIADQRNGVRILSSRGMLTTLVVPTVAVMPERQVKIDVKNATGVAAISNSSEDVIYIANAEQLIRFDQKTKEALVGSDDSVQGLGLFGHPYAVAAVGEQGALYTDLRNGTVHYIDGFLNWHKAAFPQIVGDMPPEGSTWGLQDRRKERSFAGPMGIAIAPNQKVIVADAIRRQVRILRFATDFTRRAYNDSIDGLNFRPGDYRIVLTGNSMIEMSQGFSESVGSDIERRLYGAVPRRRVHVGTLVGCLPDPEVLGSGIADLAVIVINEYMITCVMGTQLGFEGNALLSQSGGKWQDDLRTALQDRVATLHKNGVSTLIVLVPLPWEIAPIENLHRTEAYGNLWYDPNFYFDSDYTTSEKKLTTVVTPLDGPFLNLFPTYRKYEASPHADTLYATDDFHLSPRGRAILGDSIAAYLKQHRPWSSAP